MSHKLFTLGCLLWLISQSAMAQMADPVAWNFSALSGRGDTVLIEMTATIRASWKMYALQLPEGGPLPTKIQFNSGRYAPVGEVSDSPKPTKSYDAIFKMTIGYYTKTVRFIQKMVPGKAEGSNNVSGSIEYMCCNDESCVALTKDFSIPGPMPGMEKSLISGSQFPVPTTIDQEPETPNPKPETRNLKPETAPETRMWGFFFLCLLGGFAGILTPCVFPMIPMTVSFFLKGEQHGISGAIRGVFFGVCIVFIYSAIGLSVSLTNAGPSFGQMLSTHWIPNLLFFILFVAFGLALLGMFEMVLPGTWSNRFDKLSGKGGLTGIFFMALTLVIVSFSCTGPIIGAILVESAGSVSAKPLVGMLGFSIAFALPFGLLAIFPAWLHKMPKSGAWMNTLKGVLGFLLLAFSMKYLLIIDQTYHLELISRTGYLAVWIAISLMLTLFLCGKISLRNSMPPEHIGPIRLLSALAALSTAVYLTAGLTGTQITAFESLLPSQRSPSLQNNEQTYQRPSPANTLCSTPRWSDRLYLPHGLQGYFDYTEGLACAREKNKPVLLVFMGHACANCKKMEASVWIDPEVYKLLTDDFIIVALYTDDHSILPKEEWITSDYDKKLKKTMGQKNADIQIRLFSSNTQPYHVILSPQGIPVSRGIGYTGNIQEFLKFLQSGVNASNTMSVSQ